MTWRYGLFVSGSLALLLLVVLGALRTAQLLRYWRPDRNLLLLPAENLLRALLLGASLGLGMLSGLSSERFGWQPPNPAGDILWGGLIGAGLALAIFFGTRWAVRRWGNRIYNAFLMHNILPRTPSEWPPLLGALLLAVALEEVLFRSLLLGGLSPPLPFWPLALALSLCFGLVHLPQGPLAIIVTAAAGLLFAWLFQTRHSLLAPLIAHYVANGLQLGLAYTRREELPSGTELDSRK